MTARDRRLQAISILWYKEGWTYNMISEAFGIPSYGVSRIVHEATLKYPKQEVKNDD
jgi:DNA-binding transcriptional regulator LsrR (DeoR family)